MYCPPKRRFLSLSLTCDLTAGMGPMLDQGAEGSCGPNTASEMISFDQKLESLPIDTPSRQFIYYNTRVLMGTIGQDSGVDNRTLLKALHQSGFCSETLWPYNLAAMTAKPPSSCYQAAQPNLITNYGSLNQDIPSIKAGLSGGHPFMLGFSVFPQMKSDECSHSGILTMPAGSSIGGHDVTGCAYTDVQLPGIEPGKIWPANTIRFRNHWTKSDGTPWGDGGYGYMPYNYASNANYANDFWVINSVNIVAPTPPTPPGPPKPPSPGSRILLSLSNKESKGSIVILGGGRISMATLSADLPAGIYEMTPSN